MKVMNIVIKKTSDSLDEFEKAFSAAETRSPYKKKSGVYFTSIEAVRNFLTPKRLAVLHQIREKNPHSIYELAKSLGRTFPSVIKDVEILSLHGLVTLNKTKDSPRNSIQPSVNYNTINVAINI